MPYSTQVFYDKLYCSAIIKSISKHAQAFVSLLTAISLHHIMVSTGSIFYNDTLRIYNALISIS